MSGTKYLLDTNIVLYILSGDDDLITFLHNQHICISVITEIELLSFSGIAKEEMQGIGSFISKIEVAPLDEAVKNIAITLRRKYKLKLPDSIIAATATGHKIPLITADKQFQSITELQLLLYNPGT
jgi:predicted nucleic acid-binding protein